jgi:hypothetical protein
MERSDSDSSGSFRAYLYFTPLKFSLEKSIGNDGRKQRHHSMADT